MKETIKKLRKIFKEDGISGFRFRLSLRLFKFYYLIKKYFKSNIIYSRYGIPLTANYGDNTFRMYVIGGYGDFYWNRLKNLSFEFIFLDIGANQGLFTIAAAKNKFNKKVYSFEPVPIVFKKLKKNIVLNNVEEKCFPINKAISDKNEKLKINFKSNHTGGSSLRKRKNNSNQISQVLEVETINYEKLAKYIKNNNEKLIIKIDVEGYELVVLKQLINSKIWKNVKEIFYEVDERWLDPLKIEMLLKQAGFIDFQKIGNGFHYDVLASR